MAGQKNKAYRQFLSVETEVRVVESCGTLRLHVHDYISIFYRLLGTPIKDGDLVHIQLFLLDALSPLDGCSVMGA